MNNELKIECNEIDRMNESELRSYLNRIGSYDPNENISMSIKRTVCYNRAKSRLNDIINELNRELIRG